MSDWRNKIARKHCIKEMEQILHRRKMLALLEKNPRIEYSRKEQAK